jgi:hypothetical protein
MGLSRTCSRTPDVVSALEQFFIARSAKEDARYWHAPILRRMSEQLAQVVPCGITPSCPNRPRILLAEASDAGHREQPRI